MSIYDKLAAIQTALNAPKDKYNKFGGYAYRSCEGILAAVKPLLAAQKCALTLSDTVETIGGRVYIRAVATLRDTEAGVSVDVSAYAREDENKKGMDGAQITGAASSYARKYALNGLFAIDDTKDADTDEYTAAQKVRCCQDCGNEIKGYTKGDKTVTAEQWAATSRARYGEELCTKCANKREAKG